MSARRRAKAKKRAHTLSPQWRQWLADNLARGATEDEVCDALVGQGVPVAEAKARVKEALASPTLAVARHYRVRAERLEQIVKLLRDQLATRAEPAAIERARGVDAATFYERYYATSTPVVLEDYMRGWPALERWQLESLGERFGDVEVEICEGRDATADYDVKAMELTTQSTMRALVDRIAASDESNDFYMIARNRNLEGPLGALLEDVVMDRGLLDPDATRGGCQLWVGPAGTVTPLHHDTSNILFCQVVGEKRVRLASPTETALLDTCRAMYAHVDPETTEAELALREVELGPGDALFLPVGWWHHVRALSASVSIAFVNFARDNDRRWYCPGKVS